MFWMLSLLLAFLILYFPEKNLFGVFLVRRTALCTIRTAGELAAWKPGFIALPLNGDCKMHGFRQNATSKFRVDFSTHSPLLYVFSVTIPENLASSYCSHCFIKSILNILIIDECSHRSAELCWAVPGPPGLLQICRNTAEYTYNEQQDNEILQEASCKSSTFATADYPSFLISTGQMIHLEIIS